MDRVSCPLAPYPSPDNRDQQLHELAAAARGNVHHIGTSQEGRAIWCAQFDPPQNPNTQRPRALLVAANIHGPEFISSQIALGVIAAMQEPAWKTLRAQATVLVIPCLNPDGYTRTWSAGGAGRLRVLRPNASGVDLNRNFPLPTGTRRRPWPGAGSSNPKRATYKGPHPGSEPEVQAVMNLHRRFDIQASVNGHSFMGRLITPRVKSIRDYRTYGKLCLAFGDGQKHTPYKRLASRYFDTVTGELEDYQHSQWGTWAVCMESFPVSASLRQHLRAPSLFFRFNPRDPEPWVDNDVGGIHAYLTAALALDRPEDAAAALSEAGVAGGEPGSESPQGQGVPCVRATCSSSAWSCP